MAALIDADHPVHVLLERLDSVRSSGGGWSARCPAHDDGHASLSVNVGEEQAVLVKCHAGCKADRVLAAAGLSWAAVGVTPHVAREYEYRSVDGTVLYAVQRWVPKDFRTVGLPSALKDRVIYNLPWVAYGIQTGQTIYVVEGEKDVETLRDYGLIGTTNVGGRGKWLPHYADLLAGGTVVVVADIDADRGGEAHARTVYHAVRSTAASVTLCRPLWGKDVSDLLRAGYPITHVEPVPEEAPLESLMASSVRPARIRWAWERYVPMGTVTIFEGDPGDGKSTLTCDLVARWSSGLEMPDGSAHGGPWHCMVISAEDDPAATIVPRLIAAGANLDRVILVTGGSAPDSPFNLGVDLVALESQIRQYDVRILILDPLMAFMPDKQTGHVDAEVRRALYPLKRMSEKLGVAIVVVRHLTKSATRALYAGSGSIGIVGAARAAFLIKPDPNNREQRIIAPTKANLVRKPPALSYVIEDDAHNSVGRVRWIGEVPWDADTLFAGDGEGVKKQEMAADWLEALLDNSFMTWKEIIAKGKGEGFNARTLERARGDVARHVTNPPGIGGMLMLGTYWHRVGQWPFDGSPDGQSRGDGRDSASTGFPGTQVTGEAPRSHSPSLGSAVSPTSPDGEIGEAVGEGNRASDSVIFANFGVGGEGDDADVMRARARDAELAALPLECDVCGEEGPGVVMRFGRPYWVVRCKAHHPRRYTP